MRTSRLLALGAAAALAVTLSACSSSAPESTATTGGNPASDDAFPVTIEHVYGETTIDEKPERVATIAWANHEVPLALGIVPVGMSKATWGDDDDNGILPWVEEKLDELGGETPVLFDETDGIDYEAVADTAPDVILAAYSGLTQEEYDTLSKIAPVVAYPDVAWGTSVDDMVEMNAKALGLEAEGEALIEDLHADADAALAANSALEGKKVLFAYFDPSDLSQIGYYTAADTRPGYLHDLGLPLPAIVEENADSDQFYLQVSAEEAQKFDDVDVLVTYGDDSTLATLQADPLLSKIPAIAEGRVAILPDATPIAASANPSALSIPWGLEDYLAILAAPLAK
ncbi:MULTISPECIES: iron-siderophore ABC transporter substrate-binding protein [Microbacterium]|uniref:iron-siderophore ABC transporter substrate-binding protein n=1 Tax=Microbacterium TaxID=33882 RepID=UPI000F86AB5D|nr:MULTISPECIES: iron-siderophore ABC transporter substrate-binding protein [unclassified Microbacterium]RUQ05222.1 iron-siderophore ABC transporter substrate-binding protein [Microbacterium sp. HSID17254]